MTRDEWLKIGLQNGIIELEEHEYISFYNAYSDWFKSKCKINKASTVDRIEVTYNKYFAKSPFIEKCTSNITEKDIISFITAIVTESGQISKKDYERIFQILRGVLVYVKDMQYVGSRLYDWDAVKRNIPSERINTEIKHESAPTKNMVNHIITCVVHDNIYPIKRSASLLLCLNFYLGLRIGELAALQFSDFDLQNKVVHVHSGDMKSYERDADGNRVRLTYATSEPKNANAVRIIPLIPEAIYIYEKICTHHKQSGYKNTYLCYDGADTIRIRSLDRTLTRLCTLCSTQHYNSHLIRKTFATTLHHANVPTRIISDLMGHAEMRTTERSYILSYEDANMMYYDYMKNGLNYN